MTPTGIGGADRSAWRAPLTGIALLLGCQPNVSSTPDADGLPPTPVSNVNVSDCLVADYPIVFSAALSPEFVAHVAVRSADGSRGRFVSPTGKYYSPTWSPDGRTVALRCRMGTEVSSSLVLMAPDGSDEPLFDDESPSPGLLDVTRLDAPTWAPDGQSLAFASLRDSNTWAIWLISRSGGQLRRLLPDLEQPHFSPSWSRQDANRLVMVLEDAGVQDLWLVDVSKPAATENLTRGLAAQLRNPRSPRWSPDGQRIAFSAEPVSADIAASEVTPDQEIYVLELATQELTRVTFDPALDVSPAWSPDGKQLLIASNRARTIAAGESFLQSRFLDLWRVTLDGSEDSVLFTREQGINSEADWYGGGSCQGQR